MPRLWGARGEAELSAHHATITLSEKNNERKHVKLKSTVLLATHPLGVVVGPEGQG